MTNKLQNFVADQLTILTEAEGSNIHLRWRGKSTDINPGKILKPFFEDIYSFAGEQNAAVVMHFEELEYLNSSTVSALIRVMQEMRERGVKCSLVFDSTRKWQRVCFEALKAFETTDGGIEMKTSQ